MLSLVSLCLEKREGKGAPARPAVGLLKNRRIQPLPTLRPTHKLLDDGFCFLLAPNTELR